MQDRAVAITGGFGNLGTAAGRAFVARGAKVALLDRALAPAALSGEFGPPHLVLGGVDFTSPAAAAVAMDTVRQGIGSLDVLVNVAGGFAWQTVEQGDPDTWDQLYAKNLKTALVATRAALPQILASRAGRIINIGAGAAAARASVGMGAYTASKAAVHKLTESLADELKDRGVTVNAVLPGTIDTPQNRAAMPDADPARWVAPEAVAEVIVFLASGAAHAVTGAAIPVAGRG